MLVEGLVIVEIKAVERLLPIHEAQLLSYLKLSNKKLGLLINFHTLRLKKTINGSLMVYDPISPRPLRSLR